MGKQKFHALPVANTTYQLRMLCGKTTPVPGFYNAQTVDYMLKCHRIAGINSFGLLTLTSYLQKVKPLLTFDFEKSSLFSEGKSQFSLCKFYSVVIAL
jgi:hypothetical protein